MTPDVHVTYLSITDEYNWDFSLRVTNRSWRNRRESLHIISQHVALSETPILAGCKTIAKRRITLRAVYSFESHVSNTRICSVLLAHTYEFKLNAKQQSKRAKSVTPRPSFFWGRLQLKCDGTRWRTEGEVEGKLANGVGSQYPSHYLGTWCIQHYYRWCAHLGCQLSTELTPPPI